MKAIVVASPGRPEDLAIRDVPEPAPREGEILIDVRATALNRADLLQRRGLYPPPEGAPDILGLECAGTVAALGAGACRFSVGDRVMALLAGGGYAERVAVHERLVMTIPDSLDFQQAAAIPEAFLTADEALFGLGALEPGETVLIHAAASGVGTAAVQLALRHGASVVGTASVGAKLELLEKLGVTLAVDRNGEDFAERLAARGIAPNVVLDVVGKNYAERHGACLAQCGRWIVMGTLSGAVASVDLGRVLKKRLRILGLVMRSRPTLEKAAVVARFSRRWLPLLGGAAIHPVIDSVLPLERAGDAHRRMEQNLNVGKIVLALG
ncbi:MAG TPA: NAD(P)H-quinone oxidoreductase [Polyangiaceae bacterium]